MIGALSYALHKALVLVGVVYLIAAVAVVLVLGITIFFLCRALLCYLAFRWPREIYCPGIRGIAVVQVDPLHACLTALFDDPAIQLSDCSLWPERLNCGCPCLKGFERRRRV